MSECGSVTPAELRSEIEELRTRLEQRTAALTRTIDAKNTAEARVADMRRECEARHISPSHPSLIALSLRAEAAEAQIARVEAMADEWLSEFGPASELENVMGQQSVTIKTAVRLIRAALKGDA